MLPPILVSFLDAQQELIPFLKTFALVLILGLLLWLPMKSYQKVLRAREGFIVATLFWLVFGALGGILIMMAIVSTRQGFSQWLQWGGVFRL